MAIKLTTSRESARLNGVKMLVYGRAGVGKTMLCATAPNPIIISAESGMLSLRNFDIPVIEISTLDDLVGAFHWASTSAECAQFQTVCLDSITEIGEKVLAHAKTRVKDPRQAYGELIEKMNDTIKAFRDLKGKHVYMSAKSEFVKDEVSGVRTYMPSMPGSKLGQALPYLFDEVFNLDIGKTTEGVEYRFFRTSPDFQYEAKDRSGALDKIERPDLRFVIDKILAAPEQATQ